MMLFRFKLHAHITCVKDSYEALKAKVTEK